MVPPIDSMLVFTTSMPTPRPETLVTAAAVEKPGRKISCSTSAGVIRASASAVTRPRSTALAPTRAGSMPPPSSATSTTTWPLSCRGTQGQHALGGLAGGDPVGGGLDAVVDGVADQVGQRVLDRLEQRLVQLGLPADHLQPHVLAALQPEVADD